MAGTGVTLQETGSDRLLVVVRRLLEAKGIATTAEIAERIEVTDRASPGQGARMVARAWTDPDYRALLIEDGSKAAEMLGIPMRGMPPLGVLENAPGLHHLVVCTLCSCYPRAVLGYPPYWIKNPRSKLRGIGGRKEADQKNAASCGEYVPKEIQVRRLPVPRGLIAVGHRAADGHQGDRGRFDCGLSLDGAAD